VGDVGAAVGVLQAADLRAGVVDALGEFVRHHPALLAEFAEYGREALASYERADHVRPPGGSWACVLVQLLCVHPSRKVCRGNERVVRLNWATVLYRTRPYVCWGYRLCSPVQPRLRAPSWSGPSRTGARPRPERPEGD